MKGLIACEESQTVCKAFRSLGFETYSCDIKDCTGGHPEWHIKGDAIQEAYSGKYNFMVAHPPCTFMSKAGARWMYPKAKAIDKERYEKAMSAKKFFMLLLNAPIKYKCLENPTPLKVVGLLPHTQALQPYFFGHGYSKRTLLWLVNLPKLEYTNVITEFKPYLPSNTGGRRRGQKFSRGVAKNATEASKTFSGIAEAMASQFGYYMLGLNSKPAYNCLESFQHKLIL